ncbi:MAG: hypothetical protein M3Q49_07740 [Actinomycetota bacterium]|nr:hypothetical protein [Actinomycetota bacterium]
MRVFEPDAERDAPVVVLTELAENAGHSVTDAAEDLAATVLGENQIRPPVVFIEHHENGARGTPEDPHTFDLLTFERLEVRADTWEVRRHTSPPIVVSGPSRKPLDRVTVEALVGGTVD